LWISVIGQKSVSSLPFLLVNKKELGIIGPSFNKN